MSSLQGNQIKDTYSSLLKTNDNSILGAVEKEITDGVGNASTLKLGTTSASFVGTLDLSGATVTGIPSGGGGSDLAEGQNITTGFTTLGYSIPWVLSGYSTGSAKYMGANILQLVPFYAKPGESISEFYVRVQTAAPSSTINIGLYKSYVGTSGSNKYLYPEYVSDIALGVDSSTTGKKLFTGLNILLPTDAYGGQYWIGFVSDTSGTILTKWVNWVAAERSIYNDIYRANGTEITLANSSLPTGQLDLSTGATSTTDLCVDFAWKYKS